MLPESLIDESVTLPEWPGDWVAPQAADFIVENLDQYLADLAASSIGWVNPDDYLTDEEKAAYAAAQEEANTAYKKWISKYNSYMNTIQEALETNYQFQQGILRLSDNGRYLMANTKVYDFEKEIDYTIPTLIDVDTRATKRYNDSRKLTPTYVANDGTMLASRTTVMGYVKGFIAPISGDSFVEIYDFVAEQDETLAAWMKTNMTHLVSDMEYDSENERWVNIGSELLVGYPTADAELSLLASWLYNTWSEETITYSYILDFSSLTAIHTVAIDSNIAIKASKGQLTIKGDAALVNVVDLQGRQAWSRKAIHGEASATLPSGLYIVTVTDSEGHTSSRKISL
ncbi:MAG: T9SS type A sorting domain-containing protein [Bacteroidales bacterium]|nr:T9SS type A sorting domain-containing protein [Bacteroidales bacterium]